MNELGKRLAAIRCAYEQAAESKRNNLAEVIDAGEYERAYDLIEKGHDIDELNFSKKQTPVNKAIYRVTRAIISNSDDLDASVNMTVFLIDKGANLDFKPDGCNGFWDILENCSGSMVSKNALNSIFQALEDRLEKQDPEAAKKLGLEQPA